MTNGEQEKKEAELKELEKAREIGIKVLKGSLPDLSFMYFLDIDKNFGERDNSIAEQYKYFPAFSKLSEDGFIQSQLLKSRKGGKRLSGDISEYGIVESAAATVQNAISSLKVSDLPDYLPINKELLEKYKDKYVSQLKDIKIKNGEQEISLYNAIIGTYQSYLVEKKLSEAYSESSKDKVKGLEKILTSEDSPKDKKE